MTITAIAEVCVGQDEYTESLEALMQRRLSGRVRDLRIILHDNGVVLKGRCSTYHAKQLAQHAAMEIMSIPIVANEIEVC